jgi:hypothetical protein
LATQATRRGEVRTVPGQRPPAVRRAKRERKLEVRWAPGAAGSVGCTWEGNGQTILILVRNNTGGLPIQVKQVTFTPT